MNPSSDSAPGAASNAGYRTIELRVPVLRARLVLLAACGVAVAGAAAFGGVSAYHHFATGDRVAQARQKLQPGAGDALAKGRADLNQAEGGLQAVAQRVDQSLAATAARRIDIAGLLDAQATAGHRLDQAASDLGEIDRQEADLRAAFRLPSSADLLAASQRQELDGLRQRQQADLAETASLGGRITEAAKRRESLAKADQEGTPTPQQRQTQALNDAIVSQAAATNRSAPAVAEAIDAPYVPPTPSAILASRSKTMQDAIQSQAQATGQSAADVARSLDDPNNPPPAPPAPAPSVVAAPTDQPTTPPPPVPPQTTVVYEYSAPPVYYVGNPYPYYPGYYGRPWGNSYYGRGPYPYRYGQGVSVGFHIH